MTDKIKRGLTALAALAALALGGAAIANATGGGDSEQATAENEQADGNEANEAADAPDQPGDTEEGDSEEADGSEAGEAADAPDQPGNAEEGPGNVDSDQGGDQGDPDTSVSASEDQQARAAAEQATGGTASGEVEPAEQPGSEDEGDSPPPSGAAYEVEINKGGQALKVYLDASFKALDTVSDSG